MEFIKSNDEVVFSTFGSLSLAEEARRELLEIEEQEARQAEFNFECALLFECI